MWLACFMGSLCTLGALHGLYGLAVSLRLLDPRLYRCVLPSLCGTAAVRTCGMAAALPCFLHVGRHPGCCNRGPQPLPTCSPPPCAARLRARARCGASSS